MKYFKKSEFACKCCGLILMHPDFLQMIDIARDKARIPFVITSGYRCKKHNEEVGSTSTNHTSGKAADISCKKGLHRYIIVKALLDTGFKRIGIGHDFIHCDINDLQTSIWIY